MTAREYFGSTDYLANVAGHAAVGCATGAAGGGNCASGALSAAAGAAAAPATVNLGNYNMAMGLTITAAIGGTTSMLAGGTFEDGAWTSALGYLFNEVAAIYDRKTGELSVKDLDTDKTASGNFFSGGALGDQIPAGNYAILQRGDNDGFRLEAMDSTFGDDVQDATGRSLLRLHGPGRSIGCITACDTSGWNSVRSLIQGTSTETAIVNTYKTFSYHGLNFGGYQTGIELIKKYGTLTVQ